jgi:hypothetical protein
LPGELDCAILVSRTNFDRSLAGVMANAVHKLLEKSYVIDLFHCFSSAEHNRKAAGQIPSLIQINDGVTCLCMLRRKHGGPVSQLGLQLSGGAKTISGFCRRVGWTALASLVRL